MTADRTIEAMTTLGWLYESEAGGFSKDGVLGVNFIPYHVAQVALDAAERGERWEYSEAANEL
jgi:hypothetical protein